MAPSPIIYTLRLPPPSPPPPLPAGHRVPRHQGREHPPRLLRRGRQRGARDPGTHHPAHTTTRPLACRAAFPLLLPLTLSPTHPAALRLRLGPQIRRGEDGGAWRLEELQPEHGNARRRSPGFLAPQVISAGLSKHGKGGAAPGATTYDGTKADVWSLGVLMFLMLTKELPIRVNFKARCAELCCAAVVSAESPHSQRHQAAAGAETNEIGENR